VILKVVRKGVDWLRVYANDLAAGTANQVQMRSADAQELVAALAVAGIDDGNDSKILQQVQRAIDRRDVHGGAKGPNLPIDLLGSGKALRTVHH
jgi:hypothetical protein